MYQSRVVVVCLSLMMLTAVATAGGLGSPKPQPNLPVTYVGLAQQSGLAGELELIVALKVVGNSYYASVLGPAVSGVFSLSVQGPINSAGYLNFVVYAKSDKTPVTYNLAGTKTSSGIAGVWSGDNGHKGSWRADSISGITNAGTWTTTAPVGETQTFSWTSAYALLGTAKGHDYLVVLFDSPSTSFALVDAVLTVRDPASLVVGKASPLNDLLLMLTNNPTFGYYAKEGAHNTANFSQLQLKADGLLSGTVTSTEKQFSTVTHLQLTNQAFTNIRVVRDYRKALVH